MGYSIREASRLVKNTPNEIFFLEIALRNARKMYVHT